MAVFCKDKMTADERMVALLNREPIDRVPVWGLALGFLGVNMGNIIYDVYYDASKAFDGVRKTADMYGWQNIAFHGYGSQPCDSFGGDLKPPSGEFIQSPLPIFPVQSEEDAWNLKKPDVRTVDSLERVAMDVAKIAEEHKYETFKWPLVQDAWTCATMLTGVDVMLKWAKKKPDLAHHLLKMTNSFIIDKIQWWADTFGAERLIPFDSIPSATNQIIGPDMFEEFVLPYMLEAHKTMLSMGVKHILIHFCGYQRLNYPIAAQIPVGDPGIISVSHDVDADWPSPLEGAAKYFPNDILLGNVEPAALQVGSSEEIYKISQQCIEIGKRHEPGFFLSTGCEMPPAANPYNVWQMSQACNDFGYYD